MMTRRTRRTPRSRDEELGEDETIEEFESRVLNKRAALLHRQLARNFSDSFTGMTRRCNRKQVAQKFHSILVLQKMILYFVQRRPRWHVRFFKKSTTTDLRRPRKM